MRTIVSVTRDRFKVRSSAVSGIFFSLRTAMRSQDSLVLDSETVQLALQFFKVGIYARSFHNQFLQCHFDSPLKISSQSDREPFCPSVDSRNLVDTAGDYCTPATRSSTRET